MANAHDFAGLNVKVVGLENDVHELKAGFNSLAIEMRGGFAALSTAIAERSRTPWVSIASGAAVVVTVLGFIGQLALSPIQTDLSRIKDTYVSLRYYETRHIDLLKTDDMRLAAMQKEIDDRNTATQKATDATITGINKLLDVEREATHTAIQRLFDHIQNIDNRIAAPPPK